MPPERVRETFGSGIMGATTLIRSGTGRLASVLRGSTIGGVIYLLKYHFSAPPHKVLVIGFPVFSCACPVADMRHWHRMMIPGPNSSTPKASDRVPQSPHFPDSSKTFETAFCFCHPFGPVQSDQDVWLLQLIDGDGVGGTEKEVRYLACSPP